MPKNLVPDVKDLGEFSVARVLPNKQKKMVGPFVFFDHMGPVDFAPGEGVNVRPHPHIGLATLTYLLEGNILHRDSLGNCQEILPGEVNWMVGGRGITHSERESHEVHSQQHSLNGMQCWVALPKEFAEVEPSFTNIKRDDLPHYIYDGISANEGDTVLVDANEEIKVTEYSRMILLGGEHWPETPHLFWNFVAFDKDRIEKAKADWRAGKFATVPGDDYEFIPLPE